MAPHRSLWDHYGDALKVGEFQDKFPALAQAEKWDEILVLGTEALQAAKHIGRVREEAKICAQLTSTSFYKGNYSQALEYARRCHELFASRKTAFIKNSSGLR